MELITTLEAGDELHITIEGGKTIPLTVSGVDDSNPEYTQVRLAYKGQRYAEMRPTPVTDDDYEVKIPVNQSGEDVGVENVEVVN